MNDDTVPNWLFAVVFFGGLAAILLLYRWLDHWRKR